MNMYKIIGCDDYVAKCFDHMINLGYTDSDIQKEGTEQLMNKSYIWFRDIYIKQVENIT